MIRNNFASRLVITSQRKALATALVYGLSLAVRFTSATGEEVEIPPQSLQRTSPVFSIMAKGGARLPYQDWSWNSDPPIALHRSCASSSIASLPH